MITYIADFMPAEDRFARLWDELAWERRSDAPRREYWTNTLQRSYTYGEGRGQRTYLPQASHPAIEAAADRLQAKFGWRYEGCFLNGYEGARDALGWHADDDEGIDHAFPIAVVSLYGPGAASNLRTIQTRSLETGALESYPLADGSLFLMGAGMQATHQHRIPKSGFQVRPRISLTFRKLVAQRNAT